MRLIDADALLKKWLEQKDPELMTMEAFYEKMICQILTLIYDAPTINAVEVVRCKDCKHSMSDGGALMECDFHEIYVINDDYCSYGEGKDDETN